MASHEIDYEIKGESIQIVEIELDPMETVIAEAGAMLFMEDGITFEAKMGDGSNPNQGIFDKLLSMGSRILTGESLFMTHFTNRGNRKARLGFSAPYPGTIVPIDLAQMPSNQLIVQKDGFLCAAFGTKVSITFNKRIGSGLVGGEGFILQKLQGDGKALYTQEELSSREHSTMKRFAWTRDVLLRSSRRSHSMCKPWVVFVR
jgi:uncharacterized protein (AIM24 family)